MGQGREDSQEESDDRDDIMKDNRTFSACESGGHFILFNFQCFKRHFTKKLNTVGLFCRDAFVHFQLT